MSLAMTFEERYRAIDSRDARFDGQFVTAVRSTGIYCRPSCPARTPKPSNVTFFPTSAAAHEAGYRACKRCLPEAAPGSPHWNLRGDTAGRAMRLIADGVVEREGVPGLARRLGYSPRHLTRLLTAELGAGPLALSRAHRAQTARMLLVGTDLPAADVAFSAGFSSVRQFNDTVREVFGMPPLELRARRRALPSTVADDKRSADAGAPATSIDLV
ncbi:MAG TPA: Ada metal-binding domain-containing protein, partial [Microbacterium sp.]|nr:Ada metal-binding domain-containing protein [Microbacterium sp.]